MTNADGVNEGPINLTRRLEAVAARMGAVRRAAHAAEVREALTRADLTLALNAALIGREDALAARRAGLAHRYFATARPRPPRRHNRASRALDRLLHRLGGPGRALIIARSGLWRGAGLRDMAAYVGRGPDPAAQSPSLVDQRWYLETYPDVAASGVAPLLHYLMTGAREGRSPHPLFDAAWYGARNAQALAATGLSPLEHFVRTGAATGCDPHPLFDIAWYLGQGAEVGPDEDALSHYLRTGAAAGLSPHPLFDSRWYREQIADPDPKVAPLVHYLAQGWKMGLSPHPLFDPAWYLTTYPDVAEAGIEPLTHFVAPESAGVRSPGPWFDAPHYAAQRGDDLPKARNPLVDYLHGGAWRTPESRPGFPTIAYLAAHPELVREGMTPLEHWARRFADRADSSAP